MVFPSGCENMNCWLSFSWQLSPGQLDYMSNMQFANNGIQMNTTIGQPQGQVHAWFIFVIGQDA